MAEGGVMIEQEDELQKDELTTAYLTGRYDARKAYEQRLAEAEELKADFKRAMKLFEDTGLDNLLWKLLDTVTKEE